MEDIFNEMEMIFSLEMLFWFKVLPYQRMLILQR